eukprot:gene1838-2011_t
MSSFSRYFIAVFVALIIFGNHYTRDCPGALEKQIESELHFSARDYSLLNTVYFFPNMMTPLLAGMFIKELGGIPKAFFLSVFIVSIGHLIVGFGVEYENRWVMLSGKVITGCLYEIIDALMPIIYLSPIYKEEFPMVVGILQIFLRSGSIVNFILSPMIYAHYGLKAAFWVSTLVGCTALPLFLAARYLEIGSLHLEDKNTSADDEKADGSEVDEEASNTTATTIDSAQSHVAAQGGRICGPVEGFGWTFYLFLLTGAFLYGGIVPLWFFGSKYLQDRFTLSVSAADCIVALPEVMVVVVGIPVGFLLSYCSLTMQTKLQLMTGSLGFMTCAYLVLLYLGVQTEPGRYDQSIVTLAVMAVGAVGMGFSLACNVFWALVSLMVAPEYLSQATGLVSCGVNLLPAVLPPLIAALSPVVGQQAVLVVLSLMTCFATLASFGAALLVNLTPRYQIASQIDEKSNVKDDRMVVSAGQYEMVPVSDPIEEECKPTHAHAM